MGQLVPWPIVARTTPERRHVMQVAMARIQFRQGVALGVRALKSDQPLPRVNVTTPKGANVMLGIRAYAASQMQLWFWTGPVRWFPNDRSPKARLRDWLVWKGWVA